MAQAKNPDQDIPGKYCLSLNNKENPLSPQNKSESLKKKKRQHQAPAKMAFRF